MGLEGHIPETIDPEIIPNRLADIRLSHNLKLGGVLDTYFDNDKLLLLKNEVLPFHSNAIKFSAFDQADEVHQNQFSFNALKFFQLLHSYHYYSIGGGFVIDEDEVAGIVPVAIQGEKKRDPPFPFHTASDLVEHCLREGLSIAELQMRNEIGYGRDEEKVHADLLHIWNVMNSSIEKGMKSTQVLLPGGLNVKRRAPVIFKRLGSIDPNALVNSKLSLSAEVPFFLFHFIVSIF